MGVVLFSAPLSRTYKERASGSKRSPERLRFGYFNRGKDEKAVRKNSLTRKNLGEKKPFWGTLSSAGEDVAKSSRKDAR
jgi:hypothetical protein